MAGRTFLGLLTRTRCSYPTSMLNWWGRIGYRSYSTSERIESTVKETFKTMQDLNFEQFRKTKVKPFEEFKESPRIKELFDNDIEKVSKAYEDYCVCKFNRYRLAQHGGNPGTMM